MASATPERFKRLTDAIVAPHETRAPGERDDTARAHSCARVGAFDVTGARTARPLSREDYFHRLRTFRDASRWFGKPAGASAPACAARGWILEAKDLLRCETCEALLAYPSCENVQDDVEAIESVAREMIDALATTHERGCAWRETACSTSARTFPANAPATTRTDFAARVDAIARGGGKVPMCAMTWCEENGARARRKCGMETSERERVARLVSDARTHAEEAETSLGEREDDLTPLERRSVVDFATEMALFGWSPVPLVEGVESDKRAYGCALCGARAPEWTFTSVLAARKQHVSSSAQRASKKAKTGGAALRGALGGSYGLGGVSSVPFAPTRRDDAHKAAHERASARWVAAVAGASVLSKLTMSIAGGGATETEKNSTPFGATSASTPLFGSPRPVTATDDDAGAHDSPGSTFAAVVVAAATKSLAAASSKKRKRVTVDDNARLPTPAHAVLFDCVDEHMPYCPWICREIDHRPTEPGWRATLDVLVPKSPDDDAEDDDARASPEERRKKNFGVVDYAKARAMVHKYLS